MKRTGLSLLAVLVLPAILACGLTNTITNTVTGGDTFKPAAQLWSDVPPMPGLTTSAAEDLPLPVKLLMRTILGNLGRLNPQGTDQTTGNIDWISYELNGTPQDVSNFYTADLMTANGWEADSTNACASGAATGASGSGAFCGFKKTENGTEKILGIIATQEDTSKPTSVFFLRLETAATSQ
ncbi:MAG TPA: hypothetical protein VFH29_03165 [Anaerolineales bacterium]|nr:hypothetical protein [Anaerolineales bacterium]